MPTPSHPHLEHLAEMRHLMERSTRFMSLSGLSGIWAGLCALAGAAAWYIWLDLFPFASSAEYDYLDTASDNQTWGLNYQQVALIVGTIVLIAALLGVYYFTARKAHARGERIWDASSRRLVWSIAVPLLAGGLFCLALLSRGYLSLLAPATLVFYGLALVNGSKYTLRDVGHLGLCETALGLFGAFKPGYGLELWALGFGVLHIAYGAWMYNRYDQPHAYPPVQP